MTGGGPKSPGPLSRHVIEIVAPPLDIERLRRVLASGFDAVGLKLRASVELRAEAAPVEARLGRLGSAILGLLRDGKPWRLKHIVAGAGAGVSVGTVRAEVYRLWDVGYLSRPRHGVFTLAGLPVPAESDIPAMESASRGGPVQDLVMRLLDAPMPASDLIDPTGVTRQRVDQILKGLLKTGKIARVPEPGQTGRWLWVKAEVNTRAALKGRAPRIAGSSARVLSALTPDGFHWIGDLAATLGLAASRLPRLADELCRRGLAISFRLGQRRFVGATLLGLAHPDRRRDAEPAPPADLAGTLGAQRIAFVMTLAVLGEARTIDVTAALAQDGVGGRTLMSGQLVARLLASDFAEVASRDGGGHPTYRLTSAGAYAASLLSRQRPPPDRADLERRIEEYRAKRTDRLRSVAAASRVSADPAAPELAYSAAQAAILKALAPGPLPTPALARAISAFVGNPKSIHQMLRALKARGAVAVVGRDGQSDVWASLPRGAHHPGDAA